MSVFPDPRVSLTGWGRGVRAHVRHLHVTGREAPVALRSAPGTRGVIARGAGRSYADASLNDDGHVLTLADIGMRWLDRDTGLLHVDAGATLEAVNEFARHDAMMLAVVPGSARITVGGAIAADVHGKNHTGSGSFADHVTRIDLVDGAGREHVLHRGADGDPAAFWATVGGMGLTGVITAAVLQLRPRRGLADVLTEPVQGWDETVARLTQRRHDFEHTVAWFDPRAGRSVVTSAHLVDGEHPAPTRQRTIPSFAPALAAHPLTVRALNQARWRGATLRGASSTVALDEYLHPLDRVTNWNEVCGVHGFTQYQCAAADPAVLAGVLNELDRRHVAMFLVTLKAFGAANDGMLSFPIPGWTLAVDIALPAGAAARRELFAVLERLDERIVAGGGRIYLAKNAAVRPELLAAMYPRLEDFRAVRRRLDPDGVLQSDLGRRTGLCGPA